MKFIDKIFSNDPAPWKDWVLRTYTPFDDAYGGSSFLWNIMNEELDTFRSIIRVQIHSGTATSFWKDHWLPSGPIFVSHPALFSHTTRPNMFVSEVF